MSWQHIRAAMRVEAPGLSPGGRHVLQVLAFHSTREGKAWPSAATIAEITGLHRSSVLRLLKEVVESTGVSVVHKPSRASVFDLAALLERAPGATPGARMVSRKRAHGATRTVSKETEQGDAARRSVAAASPNGNSGRHARKGAVDYSRFADWTKDRPAAPVIDLSFVKRLEE